MVSGTRGKRGGAGDRRALEVGSEKQPLPLPVMTSRRAAMGPGPGGWQEGPSAFETGREGRGPSPAGGGVRVQSYGVVAGGRGVGRRTAKREEQRA